MNNEAKLLMEALCYEKGHKRRSEHILKVFALAKTLGDLENINDEEKIILNAAAILHDIAIKHCKEKYAGDACLKNQQKEASWLVEKFLHDANYEKKYYKQIIELVKLHHDYEIEHSKLLQLLIEADLIVNCYESSLENIDNIEPIFKNQSSKKLLSVYKESIKIK